MDGEALGRRMLADPVLATIALASSKAPANADDVAALVGGPAADFWAAFEQLKREHRVNVAIIRRATDPAEWLAIWPTGLPVKHETWLDQNRHGAFVALPAGAIRQHLPTRPHLDADPRPDLRAVTAGRTTTLATERRNRIAALVAEIVPAVRAAKSQPGELLPNAIRTNVQYSIRHVIERSAPLRTSLMASEIEVAGGVYDLQSGVVEWTELRRGMHRVALYR